MADTPKVYVLCDQNCKYEGLTKEQIYAAIMQAVESGNIGNVDTGFITTVKTINGTGLKFFVGEQHEYEALTAEQKDGLFAIITNDTTKEGILTALENHEKQLESAGERLAQLEESVNYLDFSAKEVIECYYTSGFNTDIELGRGKIYLASIGYGATMFLFVGDADKETATNTKFSYFSTVATDSLNSAFLYRLKYEQTKGANGGQIYLQRSDLAATDRKFENYGNANRIRLIDIGKIPAALLTAFTIGG